MANLFIMISILIVRSSAIGDVIQTLPVLEYLRSKFPDAQIDWVVERAIAPLLEQLEGNLANRVMPLDTKRWIKAPFSMQTCREIKEFCKELRKVEYDYLFDMQGNIKSGGVTLVAKAKQKIGYGKRSVREWPNLLATNVQYEVAKDLNIRQTYLSLPQRHFNETSVFKSSGVGFQLTVSERIRLELILKHCAPGIKLMIAMGSKWENKRLKEETLHAFLNQVATHCNPSFLFVYGSASEKLVADRLSAAFPECSTSVGDLSLPLWQALMKHVNGVIALDSAALHLAATTQTPTLSFFGPTAASVFKPVEERHHAFQGICPYGRTFVKQCPILRTCPTGACLREVSADALFELFVRWASIYLI